MPLNLLERPVEFHNTDEGFRHNKREGEGVGFQSREEGSGEGQEERCRRQSHVALTTT